MTFFVWLFDVSIIENGKYLFDDDNNYVIYLFKKTVIINTLALQRRL